MRVYLSIVLCFIFVKIGQAQEDELTPYEIALKRITEAEASGATVLNLSDMRLTKLSSEIGNLQNLQVLHLQSNVPTICLPK